MSAGEGTRAAGAAGTAAGGAVAATRATPAGPLLLAGSPIAAEIRERV